MKKRQLSSKTIQQTYSNSSDHIRRISTEFNSIFGGSTNVLLPGAAKFGKVKTTDWTSLHRQGKAMKPAQVEYYKQQLIKCCLTHIQDSYSVHLNRLRGLDTLELMIDRTKLESINSDIVIHLVWACISCIHHFLLRISVGGGVSQWFRRRQARKAVYIYDRLLQFLIPTYYTVVLNATYTFYDEANIWNVEYLCTNLLRRLLLRSDDLKNDSIEQLLSLTESTTLTNPQVSCQILRVLLQVEESINWIMVDLKMVNRFLDMYFRSLTPEKHKSYNYEPLEKALDHCIRSMTMYFAPEMLMAVIKWLLQTACLETIRDDNLLNFGSLIDHVSYQYNMKSENRMFPEDIFPLVLKLIASDNLLYSLIGSRILNDLLDRCGNKLKLDGPRLFFASTRYSIILNHFRNSDKEVFQRQREMLHSTFVGAVIKHGMHKIHLENIYISIALLLLEVPCSYTAAACTCLIMELQEHAIENKNLELQHTHRIHATVISLMSLICCIHKAKVLYDYFFTIGLRRATDAPHLNPPLKVHYKYAQHHVLWSKPALFFEDWEVRYGLWNCFKSKKGNALMVKKKI